MTVLLENPVPFKTKLKLLPKKRISVNGLVLGQNLTSSNKITSFENHFDLCITVLVNFMFAWEMCPHVILGKTVISEKYILGCPVHALKVMCTRRIEEFGYCL